LLGREVVEKLSELSAVFVVDGNCCCLDLDFRPFMLLAILFQYSQYLAMTLIHYAAILTVEGCAPSRNEDRHYNRYAIDKTQQIRRSGLPLGKLRNSSSLEAFFVVVGTLSAVVRI
jgi:hypothetical protein